jgi:hypothetical protein
MDFIVFFSLIGSYMLSLVFSYDIVCQWSRNLLKRIKQYPSFMQIDPKRILSAKFVLPKFHIFNHGLSCQLRYSLNFLKYSARMNGEDPERWWAHINPISMSTREMGSGSRTDTIDDHARAWNWRKITNLGACWVDQSGPHTNCHYRSVPTHTASESHHHGKETPRELREVHYHIPVGCRRPMGQDG